MSDPSLTRLEMTHLCPLCGVALPLIARYPRYVCPSCESRACSRNGRPLAFFNLGLSGGYGAQYADDHSPYDSHDCYIDGHPCRADEARFGGIVVQTLPPEPDWTELSDRQLLTAHGALLDELTRRGVVRSANNPVADYAEALVCKVLRLSREVPSRAGFDAIDSDGTRYQIKGRRLAGPNKSTQLGAIRNLDQRPFDVLAAVAFDADLSVRYAALIPVEFVTERGRYSRHANAHVFHFRPSVLEDGRVVEITSELARAQ
ncbi:hypothetical protein [Arenimonas terrae]|uniref:Uncharacterized protein n=1 Tax=Arenimonas terrae TaxID=2546226 RepID=A0A5C4RU09_9GAMM|nr:hypothetical protein [Arenimonas terrae]TNJ34409.1 hypothetical protein E1B00_01055 [Arenimonas terrae]